jgi:hypothetical protein
MPEGGYREASRRLHRRQQEAKERISGGYREASRRLQRVQ